MRSEDPWADELWGSLAQSAVDAGCAVAFASDADRALGDIRMHQKAIPISLRVEPDVLAFFKASGPGYQSRINRVLRAYAEHAGPLSRVSPRVDPARASHSD